MYPPQILILEEAEALALELHRALEPGAYAVSWARDTQQLVDFLSSEAAPLLIAPLYFGDLDAFSLMRWLVVHRPEVRLVVVVEGSPPTAHAVHFVSRQELTRLHTLARDAFSNQLPEVAAADLVDVLALLVVTQATRLLQVVCDGATGKIYIELGRVCHAETPSQRGVPAIEEVLGWSNGSFYELPWEPPAERSLQGEEVFSLFWSRPQMQGELLPLLEQESPTSEAEPAPPALMPFPGLGGFADPGAPAASEPPPDWLRERPSASSLVEQLRASFVEEASAEVSPAEEESPTVSLSLEEMRLLREQKEAAAPALPEEESPTTSRSLAELSPESADEKAREELAALLAAAPAASPAPAPPVEAVPEYIHEEAAPTPAPEELPAMADAAPVVDAGPEHIHEEAEPAAPALVPVADPVDALVDAAPAAPVAAAVPTPEAVVVDAPVAPVDAAPAEPAPVASPAPVEASAAPAPVLPDVAPDEMAALYPPEEPPPSKELVEAPEAAAEILAPVAEPLAPEVLAAPVEAPVSEEVAALAEQVAPAPAEDAPVAEVAAPVEDVSLPPSPFAAPAFAEASPFGVAASPFEAPVFAAPSPFAALGALDPVAPEEPAAAPVDDLVSPAAAPVELVAEAPAPPAPAEEAPPVAVEAPSLVAEEAPRAEEVSPAPELSEAPGLPEVQSPLVVEEVSPFDAPALGAAPLFPSGDAADTAKEGVLSPPQVEEPSPALHEGAPTGDVPVAVEEPAAPVAPAVVAEATPPAMSAEERFALDDPDAALEQKARALFEAMLGASAPPAPVPAPKRPAPKKPAPAPAPDLYHADLIEEVSLEDDPSVVQPEVVRAEPSPEDAMWADLSSDDSEPIAPSLDEIAPLLSLPEEEPPALPAQDEPSPPPPAPPLELGDAVEEEFEAAKTLLKGPAAPASGEGLGVPSLLPAPPATPGILRVPSLPFAETRPTRPEVARGLVHTGSLDSGELPRIELPRVETLRRVDAVLPTRADLPRAEKSGVLNVSPFLTPEVRMPGMATTPPLGVPLAPRPTPPMGIPVVQPPQALPPSPPPLETPSAVAGSPMSMAARALTTTVKPRQENPLADLVPLLQEIANEVPEFVAAVVLERASGMALGGLTAREELDAESAFAYYSEVMRLSYESVSFFRAPLDDMLVISGSWYVLARPFDGHILGLITTRAGNLGICRRVLRRVSERIIDRIASAKGEKPEHP